MSLNLREGIFAELSVDPVIAGVLGAGNDCRLFWQIIDQEIAYPAVAYSIYNEDQFMSMAQDSRPTLSEVPVMFESCGYTPAQCEAADTALYDKLISYSGALGSDGPVVQAVLFRTRNAGYDDGTKLYTITTTYSMFVTL